MLNFYLIASGLLLAAWLLWFFAVRIHADKAGAEQQALAREQVNTHRLRLRELDYEKDHGGLDDKEYAASVIDVKQQLLHDLSGAGKGTGAIKGRALFIPGALFLLCFVAPFYWLNGQFNTLELSQQARERLPELGKRAVLEQGEALSSKELQQFALGLRTKLQQDDEDAVAWLLLGRVTQALNDIESAALAFEKAYLLDPDKPAALINYAQILLMKGGAQGEHQAAGLLAKVLQQQADNIDALLMVAYIAEQQGDTAQATSGWQMVMAKLEAGDPRRQFVEQKLRTQRAAEIVRANAGSDSHEAGGEGKTVGAQAAKVTVHLSLSDELAGKVPEGAVLFIYAKAAKGPPMPAAVIKMDSFELPLTVELTDANAMMDSYKLSDLKQLVISTRVSRDQNIAVAAGELQGQSGVFSLADTTEISVVINQVL